MLTWEKTTSSNLKIELLQRIKDSSHDDEEFRIWEE